MVNLAEHHTDTPEPSHSKEKLSTRNKLIAAFGAGAVSVAAIFGVTHAMGNDEKSVPQENSTTHDTPPPSVNSDGNTITIETTKPESKIATGETLALLQAHSKNFDEWRGLTLGLLEKHNLLSGEERVFLDNNYTTLSQKSDKATFTDNEVLAAVALDVADTSAQEPQDMQIGIDMLPLVYSKEQANFRETENLVANPEIGSVISVFSQSGTSLPHLSQGKFLDETIKNVKDARAIIQTKTVGLNGRTEVFTELGVYVLNSDDSGNEQWQSVERYGLNDPRVQDAITNLRSHS